MSAGPLRSLQGRCIPTLVFFGPAAGSLCLATSLIEGEHPCSTSPEEALESAEEVGPYYLPMPPQSSQLTDGLT